MYGDRKEPCVLPLGWEELARPEQRAVLHMCRVGQLDKRVGPCWGGGSLIIPGEPCTLILGRQHALKDSGSDIGL